MIKPKPLSKGDTVALISPSSPVDSSLVEKSIEYLKDLGLKVIVGESCFKKHGFLSGDDYIRANDINIMFSNKEVKGILALRGGYGAARLLDKINYRVIKNNPKIFVGYSDITALHIVFNQRCNLITYHGPMVSTELIKDMDEYSNYYYNKNIFTNDPLGIINNPKGINIKTLYEGKAKGRLIGGNLSLICSGLGTKYEIDTKGKILFIEEVDEYPYKIDKMLLQLHQAGKLKDCAGILLGSFSDCIAKDANRSLSLNEIFSEIILPNKKPTILDLACGHCMPTLTLPLGARALIDASNKQITFF